MSLHLIGWCCLQPAGHSRPLLSHLFFVSFFLYQGLSLAETSRSLTEIRAELQHVWVISKWGALYLRALVYDSEPLHYSFFQWFRSTPSLKWYLQGLVFLFQTFKWLSLLSIDPHSAALSVCHWNNFQLIWNWSLLYCFKPYLLVCRFCVLLRPIKPKATTTSWTWFARLFVLEWHHKCNGPFILN